MLRKLGFAALALFGIAALGNQVYSASSYSALNGLVLSKHAEIDRLGDAAPLSSRAVVMASRLPHIAYQWLATDWVISKAGAQAVPSMTIDRGNFRNHQSFSCSAANRPTVTGATLTSGSCDYRGQVTAPTSQAPVVTFGTAYASAPICTVSRSDGQSTTGHSWTVSTTALTFASVTTGAGITLNWVCMGVMP